MLGKFEILGVILFLVFLFYLVIALGAGAFSRKEISPNIQKYLKSVKWLLLFIAVVGSILILFI
jgi:hypothetical protein